MVPRLWVKLHTSAGLKSIRIAVPMVLGELRYGHKTSVSSGNRWAGVSCFGKCPAAVSCATVDEESGSNLKLGSCVDQPDVLLSARQIAFENPFLSNKPLHKN